MSVSELKLNIRHAQENIENKSYQIKMWNERIERYNQKLKELAYKQETVKNFYISKRNKINDAVPFAKGRAIESAILIYDDLYDYSKQNQLVQELEGMIYFVRENIKHIEDKIYEAQRDVGLLERNIKNWKKDIKKLDKGEGH